MAEELMEALKGPHRFRERWRYRDPGRPGIPCQADSASGGGYMLAVGVFGREPRFHVRRS